MSSQIYNNTTENPIPSYAKHITISCLNDICRDCAISAHRLLSIEDINALHTLLLDSIAAPTPRTAITRKDTTQTPMPQDPFEQIDQGLETYFDRHGSVDYSNTFLRCMNHHCFVGDDIGTELSENCKPNECAYVWALNDFMSPLSFPIPQYLSISEQNK
eukprot:62871_1